MRRDLIRHPAVSSAIGGVTVEAERGKAGILHLRYAVADPMGALLLPARAGAVRTDGLWRRTCFEAFLRAPGAEGYVELNLSPSGAWAAYRFEGYRAGMADAGPLATPGIEVMHTPAGFDLSATVDLSGLAELPAAGPWRLGLSAVIEAGADGLSYWALAHPPGAADFHHAAGFVVELG